MTEKNEKTLTQEIEELFDKKEWILPRDTIFVKLDVLKLIEKRKAKIDEWIKQLELEQNEYWDDLQQARLEALKKCRGML